MKSSSKIILILSLFAFFTTTILSVVVSKNKSVNGIDLFHAQEEYIGNVRDFTLSLDNITSLYINGNIAEDDFYNHLCVLKAEYNLILLSYDDFIQKYPVKPGTHDYYTKIGCESAYNSIHIVSDLIDACIKSRQNIDELIYTYLAYSQELTTEFSNYTMAFSVINYDNLPLSSNTDADKEDIYE